MFVVEFYYYCALFGSIVNMYRLRCLKNREYTIVVSSAILVAISRAFGRAPPREAELTMVFALGQRNFFYLILISFGRNCTSVMIGQRYVELSG